MARVLYQVQNKPFTGAKGIEASTTRARGPPPSTIPASNYHPVVHTITGFMDAGRVHKDALPPRLGKNAQYAIPGCLGLIGYDRDFLADQAVKERGFSGVRASDDCDGAAFHVLP
jgi:hypothetical protein